MQKKAVLTELNRQLADMAEELQAQRDKHGEFDLEYYIPVKFLTYFQAYSCLLTATEACSCRLKAKPRASVSLRLTSQPKSRKYAP